MWNAITKPVGGQKCSRCGRLSGGDAGEEDEGPVGAEVEGGVDDGN
jgi:hypothetical protein